MLDRDRRASRQSGRPREELQIYNEIVLDGLHSNAKLPKSIEAFVLSPGDDSSAVRQMHEDFLAEYHLHASACPLLKYHPGATGDAFTCEICG